MEQREQYLPDYSDSARLQMMRDNFESRNETYHVKLTQEEIEERNNLLAQNSIKKFKLDEELKEVKADFKRRIDPIVEKNNELMTEIDTGQMETKGELFFIPDYDKNIMLTCDAKGFVISDRRLYPSEQRRMEFGGLRPAANDE